MPVDSTLHGARFNAFVYCYGVFSFVASVLLYLLVGRLSRTGSSSTTTPTRTSFGSDNSEFRAFQRTFILGYLPCLFADSLQAPYLYYLYYSYGFIESQIAILYIIGFVSSTVFSLLVVHLCQRLDRRLLCTLFVGLSCLSCMLKFSPLYGVLVVSRVIDGLASALLSTPFMLWYEHEHRRTYDFPKEWIQLTHRKIALLHLFVSVAAGYVAELTETTFKITAFPYLLAIPILIGGGFFQITHWSSNRLDSQERTPLSLLVDKALRAIIHSRPVLLLSVVQALFEAAFFICIFVWTPLFLGAGTHVRPTFGGVYSAFMGSMLMGTLLYRMLSLKMMHQQQSVNLLPLCCASATVLMGICASVIATLHDSPQSTPHMYTMVFVLMATYKIVVGTYFAATARMQRYLLGDQRHLASAATSLVRVPTYSLAAAALFALHVTTDDMRHAHLAIVSFVAVLNGLATVAALCLIVVNRRQSSVQTLNSSQQMLLSGDTIDSDDEAFQ